MVSASTCMSQPCSMHQLLVTVRRNWAATATSLLHLVHAAAVASFPPSSCTMVPFPTLGTGPCCSPVDDCCNAPHISFCCRAPSAPETGRHGFMTARPTMFRVVDTPRFAGRTPKSSAAAAFRAAAAASGRTQVVLDDRLLRLGLLFRAPFMRRFLLER